MLTKAVYGAVARSAGRAAAQRQLAGGGIDDRSANPLDAYLQDLAAWVEQRGYNIDSRRCLWCGKATKLKSATQSPPACAAAKTPAGEPGRWRLVW